MKTLEEQYRETLEYIVTVLGPKPTGHMRNLGFNCEGCLFEIEEAYDAAKGALEGNFFDDRWISEPRVEPKGKHENKD